MANENKCTVDTLTHNYRNKLITCTQVKRQIIYDKNVSFSYDSADDEISACNAIYFEDCIMFAFPSAESIKKFIPNLVVLEINKSKLSKITSDDLKGYNCLQDLYIDNCDIEYLPGNLFEHTPNLEAVSFYGNKIEYIDEDILVPLQNLKVFSLFNNVNIDVKYDIMSSIGSVTLSQLKNEIKMNCSQDLNKVCADQLKKITILEANEDEQLKKMAKLKENNELQRKEIADLREKYEDLKKKYEAVLQQYPETKQVSKDYTIKVDEKLFNVNKAVLIAQSQVFAKLITDDPEIVCIELKDISETTFQEILNFMNDGSEPSENANMVELFDASCRLELEGLTKIVTNHLKEEVNEINALDVLVLCNKYYKFYNNDELKMKAFAELQKNFPHQTLILELASQPEKLKKLMQAQLEMDKVVAEMNETE